MRPFEPTLIFLVLTALSGMLLIILSKRVEKYQKLIVIFVWISYMWIMLLMTVPPIYITTKKIPLRELILFSSPWNFKPFSLISRQFQNMMDGQIGAVKQFLGNIILFIPAGLIPPILFPKMRRYYGALIPGLLWSLFIELSQLILHLLNMGNRSFDMDDIILNVLGAFIGFIIYKIAYMKSNKNKKLYNKY